MNFIYGVRGLVVVLALEVVRQVTLSLQAGIKAHCLRFLCGHLEHFINAACIIGINHRGDGEAFVFIYREDVLSAVVAGTGDYSGGVLSVYVLNYVCHFVQTQLVYLNPGLVGASDENVAGVEGVEAS